MKHLSPPLICFLCILSFSLLKPSASVGQDCFKAAFTTSDVDLSGYLVDGKIALNKIALFKIRVRNVGLCAWEPYDISLRVKIISSPSGASSYTLQDMLPGSGGLLPLKERVLPKDQTDFHYDIKLDDPKTVSGTYKLQFQLYSKSKPFEVSVDKIVEVYNINQQTGDCKMLAGIKAANVKVPTGKIFSGKKYPISIGVDNLGTCAWNMDRNKVELRINCIAWPDIGAGEKEKLTPTGDNYLESSGGQDIVGGKQADFNYDVIAPSAPGEYTLELQMTNERKAFGPRYLVKMVVTGDPKKCEVESAMEVTGFPSEMVYLKEYPIVVKVTNTGVCDWTADTKLEVRCRVIGKPSGSPSELPLLIPEDGVWGLGSKIIKPGGVFEIRYKAKGPYVTGSYGLRWQVYARSATTPEEVVKSFKVEVPK